MDEQQFHTAAGQHMSESKPGDSTSHDGQSPYTLPDHLIALPDTGWSFWRWLGLRGAGFPASLALQLAMPTCAEAANLLLVQEAKAEEARMKAFALLTDEVKDAREGTRLLLIEARRQVKYGKLPVLAGESGDRKDRHPISPLSTETQASLDRLQVIYSGRERARAELRAQFDRATEQTMQTLVEIAKTERFQEAVTWQNRKAVRDGIQSFLNKPVVANPSSKQRENSQLIAKYVQRYCTKNDTIGFFGPLGWGRWVEDGAPLTVRPGPQLLARREVYFETWSITELGETLARNRALQAWAVPRPMPFLYLDGTTLHMPFVRPLELPPTQALVLAACDGQKTAREVAAAVLCEACAGLATEAEVFAVLDALCNARRISWSFEVSMEEWYPERALRKQLERITPVSLREEALSKLERLEAGRVAIAGAAGNAEQLDLEMERLEETFTDLTGRTATRQAGKTYVGRTLVYEDCRRDIELTLGPELREALGHPLALLLTSARWYTFTAAPLYRNAFRETCRRLAKKSGSATVDFATFWSWVQPLVPIEGGQRLCDTLIPEFQKRWAEVLEMPAGQRRVSYTSEALQPRVQMAFAAPHAGWRSACYHSPDVMIAAKDMEAVLRHDYELVLGEFHQCSNTLNVASLVAQHPAIPELLQAIATDLSEPRVVAILPRESFPAKRTHAALTLEKDWRLLYGVGSGGNYTGRMLPVGQLVLEEQDGEIVVRTRDRGHQFDLLEVFHDIIAPNICDAFKILAPTAHTPRVTIDRLVICRESWRFAPADLSWAFATDALERFLGLRRWMQRQELPRFFFVRTPNEIKPYYVDADSPIYVEIFAKAVRQSAASKSKDETITITEMLPDIEHLWLPGADGERYTGELRIVAVDLLQSPHTNERDLERGNRAIN